MSLCNILFLTSLKLKHGFASNFMCMFLGGPHIRYQGFTTNFSKRKPCEGMMGWTPTIFVQIRVLPLFFMELWVIMCNFRSIL